MRIADVDCRPAWVFHLTIALSIIVDFSSALLAVFERKINLIEVREELLREIVPGFVSFACTHGLVILLIRVAKSRNIIVPATYLALIHRAEILPCRQMDTQIRRVEVLA